MDVGRYICIEFRRHPGLSRWLVAPVSKPPKRKRNWRKSRQYCCRSASARQHVLVQVDDKRSIQVEDLNRAVRVIISGRTKPRKVCWATCPNVSGETRLVIIGLLLVISEMDMRRLVGVRGHWVCGATSQRAAVSDGALRWRNAGKKELNARTTWRFRAVTRAQGVLQFSVWCEKLNQPSY